jgi:hypothetical protein
MAINPVSGDASLPPPTPSTAGTLADPAEIAQFEQAMSAPAAPADDATILAQIDDGIRDDVVRKIMKQFSDQQQKKIFSSDD